jgi:ElaB/YqjD/DUF883 family membrane-anchored ribosome-binding protein
MSIFSGRPFGGMRASLRWPAVFVGPIVIFAIVAVLRLQDPTAWPTILGAITRMNWDTDDAYVILIDFLRASVAWIVIAMGLRVWLRGRDDPNAVRLRYVYVWLVGVALFALVGPSLLDLLVPGLTGTVQVLAERTALPVIWSGVVFVWLVFNGDRSYEAQNYLRQYRTVWTLLALMLVALVIVDLSAYKSVTARVEGLQASIKDAQTELNRLAPADPSTETSTANDFDLSAYALLETVDRYYQSSIYPVANPRDDGEPQRSDLTTRNQSLDDIAAKMVNTRYWALVAETEARLALRLTELPQDGNAGQPTATPIPTAVQASPTPAATAASASATAPTPAVAPTPAGVTVTTTVDRTHQWLEQPRQVIQQTANTAAAALAGLDHADAELSRLRANPTAGLDALDRIVGSEVYLNAHEVAGQAPVARQALAAVGLPVAPIFIWVSVFYALLLSVPAVLLLLFFIRKRDQRAAQILDDLTQLDPDQGLVLRALGIEPIHQYTTISNPQEEQLERARAAVLRRRYAFRDRQQTAEDPSIKYVIDRIAQRAFSNMEYAAALTLLTGLLGLGWYLVFYPDATAGLASLIGGGGGVDQITNYLASPSPINFGFAGAYFWSFQMLLRRYLAGDLYPSAFLQASQRIVIVFILSLVLSIVGVIPVAGFSGGAAIVAFAAGIFPEGGLTWILSSANSVLNKQIFPTTVEEARLIQLEGIDIWVESRLLEEKIENIQSLATAAIELLVLRTHFPTTQLVDWIDQALLYLHAGQQGELFAALRVAGVRTASDLLDVTGVLDDQNHPGYIDPQHNPDDALVARVANAAQMAKDPPNPQDFGEAIRVICDALWPDPNIRYVLWYLGYELERPASQLTPAPANADANIAPPAEVTA